MNAVFGLVDGIGVGWAEGHRHFLVILGALVLVAHQPGDRRSEGDVIEQAAEDLHPVVLAAGRGDAALAGPTAVEFGLNRCQIEGEARGAALQDHAHGAAVGFTKGADAQELAKTAAHHSPYAGRA